MKKFKKEPAPDKENLNEDITEAEEEIAAEEEEAKTAAADDEIEKLQAENRQLKEEFLRAYADAENNGRLYLFFRLNFRYAKAGTSQAGFDETGQTYLFNHIFIGNGLSLAKH